MKGVFCQRQSNVQLGRYTERNRNEDKQNKSAPQTRDLDLRKRNSLRDTQIPHEQWHLRPDGFHIPVSSQSLLLAPTSFRLGHFGSKQLLGDFLDSGALVSRTVEG